ncbi:unnamed protein product [Cunninghamella blakesleeana]
MPVEDIATKLEWKTDQVYEPYLNLGEKYNFKKPVNRVAVIGGGPAGLPTAKVLVDEGIDVVIYERNPTSGGTWIYNPESPLSPTYPAEVPSQLVQPSLPPVNASLPYEKVDELNDQVYKELLKHVPPTPCYKSLRNNVATPLLKYKDLDWPENTPWFTTHDKILSYLQDYSKKFGLDEITEFNTSLEKLTELPEEQGWKVLTKKAYITEINDKKVVKTSWKEEIFDAVVLATGHYHAPHIPNIPGIKEWHTKYPKTIIHSKQYRVPDYYKDKNVLLIGDGTSALDIARDIGEHCKIIYQSVRESNHGFDEKYKAFREEVKTWLPSNTERIATIRNIIFPTINATTLEEGDENKVSNQSSAIFELSDGTTITGIDAIVICTGYLFNYHFLQELHDDGDNHSSKPLSDKVLVKQDGSQLHNLHKDIFYIPNPTLSFVGVPFHIATFSFFEFQSYAIARVYSQSAYLPSEELMRKEWQDRLKRKGGGREFHALGAELEQEYIQDIVNWVNTDGKQWNKKPLEGHSKEWFDVKEHAFEALRKEFKQRLSI